MQVPETSRMSAGIVVSVCWRTGVGWAVSLGGRERGGGVTNRLRLHLLVIPDLFVESPICHHVDTV